MSVLTRTYPCICVCVCRGCTCRCVQLRHKKQTYYLSKRDTIGFTNEIPSMIGIGIPALAYSAGLYFPAIHKDSSLRFTVGITNAVHRRLAAVWRTNTCIEEHKIGFNWMIICLLTLNCPISDLTKLMFALHTCNGKLIQVCRWKNLLQKSEIGTDNFLTTYRSNLNLHVGKYILQCNHHEIIDKHTTQNN